MKLVIDLDDFETGADWTGTVGALLREEIEALVRREIKAALKSEQAAIRDRVKSAVSSASEDIQKHALKSLSAKLGEG